jgi:hypothetical protein
LVFEHDLFGKPVSTFPDHALRGSIEMRSQGREERHVHVALVAASSDVAPIIQASAETARRQASGLPISGFSLLRASVPARLCMAAAAAALLWGAVLWALA